MQQEQSEIVSACIHVRATALGVRVRCCPAYHCGQQQATPSVLVGGMNESLRVTCHLGMASHTSIPRRILSCSPPTPPRLVTRN